jgi:hypothetical protein
MTHQNGNPLDKVDPSKRELLDRIARGAAFVAPVVASFALDGLTISKAQAQVANGSGVAPV